MAAANDTTIEGMMGGLPGVRQFGLNTNQPVDFSGAPSVALPSGTTVAGTQNITSTSATAFTVAAAGTNYGLQVDESAANAVTGLKIASTATGTNLLLSVISPGTNDGVTLKAKGSSSVVVTAGTDNSGVFQVQNSAGSNIAFNVNVVAASNATGLSVISKAAGSGIILTSTSSGTDEDFAFNTKGAGKFRFSPGTDSGSAFIITKADGTSTIFQINTTTGSIVAPSGGLFIQAAVDGVAFEVRNNAFNTAAFQVNTTTNAAIVRGVLNVASGTATPAAGSTSARLLFGTTAGFGIYFGSNAPTVSAAQGSIYLRSDGGASTELYVNRDGGTTWKAVTTAA